jgi:hypothetical protein
MVRSAITLVCLGFGARDFPSIALIPPPLIIRPMDLSKKQRTLAALDDVSRDLIEILSDGTKLNEDEQSYIECHLRLMQLTYSNWKQGPIEKSPLAA